MTHISAKITKNLEQIARALKPRVQTHRSFHLAAIYYKNDLLALSVNHYQKTHPKAKQLGYFDSRIHAEFGAVIKAGEENFRKCKMFVLRIDNNNKLNNSAPCKFCQKMLSMIEIGQVFCTNSVGCWEEFMLKNNKTVTIG